VKKCTQCGQTLGDEAAFCGNCGGANFEPIADTGDYQQQTYQQPQQPQPPQPSPQASYYQQPNQQQYYQQPGQQPPYQQPAAYQQNTPGKGAAVASLVLGIISLVLCWWGWVGAISIVLSIIGIILGVSARKQLQPEQGRGMATGGMVCSIIALVLSTIVFISCVICAASLDGMGYSGWL
jgi:hypothetical protein